MLNDENLKTIIKEIIGNNDIYLNCQLKYYKILFHVKYSTKHQQF